MSVLEKATSHFREKISGELKYVFVPEWGDSPDKPLKIYYKPSINFKAQGKILALFKQNKDEEAGCMSLIIRALDENGKNIFNEGNMPNLLHEVDPDVVNRILAEMGANDEDSEEIKKN